TRYKLDDFKPYLFKTLDYGKTWQKIVAGINEKHFTRVIRADKKRKGLLYAGTESGVYVSFNDGKAWLPFQMNLPVVPITDLAVKNDDLVVATQGRSFWILDDLTLLHQCDERELKNDVVLFQPRPTYKMRSGKGRISTQNGQNPDSGVKVSFYLKDQPEKDQTVTLTFADSSGTPIKVFSSKKTSKNLASGLPKPENPLDKKNTRLEVKQGLNTFLWNMRYPDAATFPGLVLWAGGTNGPAAIPGDYRVILDVGSKRLQAEFQIIKDPRSSATESDFREQFEFLLKLRDKLSQTHLAIKKIRLTRKQIQELVGRIRKQGRLDEKWQKSCQPIFDAADALTQRITAIEEKLYQTKNQSP
ncbi:MAG: glycosyl hydrolase, partial [Planctomycetota bacterium]|nr:glycosyl hydrolase [Planctomycetota bacterium]